MNTTEPARARAHSQIEPGRRRQPLLRTLTTAAALLSLAALSACDTQTVLASAGDVPTSSGTLTVALDTDPICVDAHQGTTNASFTVMRPTVDSLTDQDPATGDIEPWLAESWDVSADASTFTFHLRDDVQFQDGTPFDSSSVKKNFEAIQEMGAKASLAATFLAGLTSVETPDEHTAVVSFDEPNAQFLQATSTAALGFYADSTLALSPEERCTSGLVGTGPFELDSFTPGEAARIVRNDAYDWPSALAEHTGPARLGAIDFSVVPEASVRIGALSAGDIDIDGQVMPQNEELLEASEFSVVTRPNPGMSYSLYPNLKNDKLADVRVRQALNKAIDRDELKAVISAYQSPATSVLAKTTPFYSDQSELLAYDPDEAARLLDEAGWTLNGKTGIREKDGEQLSFEQLYWQSAPFIELVQQQLREVGIDYQIRRSAVSEVTALREDRTYDFEFYNSTRSDPDIMRTHLGVAGANRNNRPQEELDELMGELASTMDAEARTQLSADVSAELIEQGYAIPLVELSGVMAVSPRVGGLALDANSRMSFYDTWVGEKA